MHFELIKLTNLIENNLLDTLEAGVLPLKTALQGRPAHITWHSAPGIKEWNLYNTKFNCELTEINFAF